MSRADLESLRIYLENLKQKYIQPLENELERIESIAKGAQGAQSFDNYSSMITKLNSLSKNSMSVGANILIVTLNVPDLWVSEIADESVPYLYVNDEYFVNELSDDGKIQVGYFVLSPLETLKVNLIEYVKFTDIVDNVNEKAGLVKLKAHGQYGLRVDESNGFLTTQSPSVSNIKARDFKKPLVSNNIEDVMYYGVTGFKETWNGQAMVGSYGNQKELSDDEKSIACEWLGSVRKKYVDDLVGDINTALEAILGV